ncbi:hypothetical protein BDY19DRAFT_124927 [Irpex rosettiformis]|uniref:Uncharacterized protein n=1 Tax=Irpex rosettiformis TaxID=378272 RepID=A0ACB8U496_9APHY|nr:hypothetical protein BDY19DRAFT_124927 [Irpex rosettiformis]
MPSTQSLGLLATDMTGRGLHAKVDTVPIFNVETPISMHPASWISYPCLVCPIAPRWNRRESDLCIDGLALQGSSVSKHSVFMLARSLFNLKQECAPTTCHDILVPT